MTLAPHSPHLRFQPKRFRPAWWLPGAHLQTLGGRYLRPRPRAPLERIHLDTPDGDFLHLDLGADPRPGAPIVLVLHGLEGSTGRAYMRLAMSEVARRGLRPVGMNFRGCSGEMNRLPRFYHSGDTADLALVLDYLHARFPGRAIGAIGFSLGGNVLLRFLGEREAAVPGHLAGAATISVPFDLAAGSGMLEGTPMGRLYARYFLESLKRKIRAKRKVLDPILDLDRVLSAGTLREFDEVATAPLHGFGGADEYYREASSGPVVERVRVPTLVLHAMDDPFLPPESIPRTAIERNPWIVAALPRHGGHVGFVSGQPGMKWFWAESEAARYLEEVLASR